jgi:hypothetical protein
MKQSSVPYRHRGCLPRYGRAKESQASGLAALRCRIGDAKDWADAKTVMGIGVIPPKESTSVPPFGNTKSAFATEPLVGRPFESRHEPIRIENGHKRNGSFWPAVHLTSIHRRNKLMWVKMWFPTRTPS